MSILEKRFQVRPVGEIDSQFDPVKEIVVLYTTPAATATALRHAAKLCSLLYGRIRLIALKVVPYPLALATPSVPSEFTENFIRDLASGVPAEIRVDVLNCRDEVETLCNALQPSSLVLIGPRQHWWNRHESRLTKALKQRGHSVLSAEKEVIN